MDKGNWSEVESFWPQDNKGLELAQELFDKGLIFLANQNALHHYGYAIGVTIGEDGKVVALNIHKTDAAEGISFDEASIIEGRKKLGVYKEKRNSRYDQELAEDLGMTVEEFRETFDKYAEKL